MAQEGTLSGSSSVVASGSATSGLNVSLHPLPILNISDHCTRTRHAAPGSKIIGALLGTQANRDLSIVNSFELTYSANAQSGPSGTSAEDVNMDGPSAASGSAVRGQYILDAEFLETRKEQFKQVFPTLDVVGWYSVGQEPDADDIALHAQFATSIDSPIFLFFDPASTSSSNQELPFRVFESALAESAAGASGEAGSNVQFVQLEYGVETGEAERIAVDGVTRGGMEGDGESAVVSNLTTQRNAIKMLSDRIAVVAQYIGDVADQKVAEPDHALLRQISSLVAALPTIDAIEFKQELHTEFEDVQLTQYLSDLTRQLNTLDEYTDKHHHLYPEKNEREPGFGGGSFGGGFGGRGVMAGGPAGGRNARTKGRH